MPAPRMRIACHPGPGPVDPVAERVAASLAAAGHTVGELSHPADAVAFDAVLVTAAESALDAAVTGLAGHLRRGRPGKIVLHVALARDAQALDEVEVAGATVGCLHPLIPAVPAAPSAGTPATGTPPVVPGHDPSLVLSAGLAWVCDAVDEVGQTVVELLVGELGGNVVTVPPERRARLAFAETWLAFIETVRADGAATLLDALGAEHAELVDTLTGPAAERGLPDPASLEARLRQARHPAFARAFTDLTRRTAERAGDEDQELWALHHAPDREEPR